MIANYVFFNMSSKGEYIMNIQSSAYSEAAPGTTLSPVIMGLLKISSEFLMLIPVFFSSISITSLPGNRVHSNFTAAIYSQSRVISIGPWC
jgi:hypothetical protein